MLQISFRSQNVQCHDKTPQSALVIIYLITSPIKSVWIIYHVLNAAESVRTQEARAEIVNSTALDLEPAAELRTVKETFLLMKLKNKSAPTSFHSVSI